MEGGSNLGDGKNGGNNISGSDMPTNNGDLVDYYCRDISGCAVTQRSRFDYMYHCTVAILIIFGLIWFVLVFLVLYGFVCHCMCLLSRYVTMQNIELIVAKMTELCHFSDICFVW